MSGTQLVIITVTMSLMYWVARGMTGGCFVFFLIASPTVVGVVVGLIYGDLAKGLVIGDSIAAVFAGIIAPGGNLPTDSTPAATTIIPTTLAVGLTAEQAIASAVPMGLLDSSVINLRKAISVILVHGANEFATKGNLSGITRCAVVYLPLIEIPLLFLPVFLIVMPGQDAMLTFINSVPNWVMHGLEIADSVTPAIGFALIINMIGKSKMIPYAVLGPIVAEAIGLNTLTAGLVTGCVTMLAVLEKREKEKEGAQKTAEERKTSLTKRDANRVIARWHTTAEMSPNYGRVQSTAYTYTLTPASKKLYSSKEDMIPTLQRHLELSNTDATAGGLTLGTTLAMEEEEANNPDAIPSKSIAAVKTGLMGPVVALGSFFNVGIITTLFIPVSYSLAQGGSIAGFQPLFLGTMYTLGELTIFTKTTYIRGRSAVKDIMSGRLTSNITEGANVLGMTMMGALTISMVNPAVAVTANFDEVTLGVQGKIDGIMSGILSIGMLFIYCYLISKKHVSVAELVFFTIAIVLLRAATGLFQTHNNMGEYSFK